MMSHNRITLWFSIAVAILCLDAGFVYKNFMHLDAQNDWVSHTYQVMNEIEGVVSEIKDIQSAQRGYIITGQYDYLTPYDIAQPKVKQHIATLEMLVADNAAQEERLRILKSEAEARIAIAAKIIAAFQREGQKQAFTLVKTGTGKKEMDQIRAVALEMIAEERHLLDRRQIAVQQAKAVTERVGIAGLLACLVILVVVFLLMSSETARRRKSEAALNDALSETKAAAEEDALLSQIGNYMQAARELSEVYNILHKDLPHLLPNTSGAVYFFNNSRNLLELGPVWGTDDLAAKDFSPEDCWALRQGQLHMAFPGGLDPVCAHIPALPPGGAACLPLQSHGEMTGLLYVTAEDRHCLEVGRKRLDRVGGQIALAVANIKLQSRLRDQSIRDPLT
jgi:CHASE3 domain sensor protein